MMPRTLKLMHVVGARPNFMKMAPVIAAVETWNAASHSRSVRFDQVLVHTGQHYDEMLSRVFFEQLAMPEPDENLGVGSGSQAGQTARLLVALEPVMLRHRPGLVIVPGDVNSTCAGALVAAKLSVPVAHLEAGLRSGDRRMPEEINRIIADHVADLHLTTCADADANLMHEGIPHSHIVRVGNTMIDSLIRLVARAEDTVEATQGRLDLRRDQYVLVTLHRPTNVDVPDQLARLMGVLLELSRDLPVVFPVHRRTQERLSRLPGLVESCRATGRLVLTDPLGYLEFLGLMMHCSAVITDSGGIQEETTVLGIPCVTVRTTTERPITVTLGTNQLVDPLDRAAILAASRAAVSRGILSPAPEVPLWDGKAGERVAEALAAWAMGGRQS